MRAEESLSVNDLKENKHDNNGSVVGWLAFIMPAEQSRKLLRIFRMMESSGALINYVVNTMGIIRFHG